MYKIQTTNRFEKDVIRCKKRGLELDKLKEVMSLLAENGKLPIRYKPHKLLGKYYYPYVQQKHKHISLQK